MLSVSPGQIQLECTNSILIPPSPECQVIITEKLNLQTQLDALAKSKSADKLAELHLLVSSAIDSITYHISKAISKVFVAPCSIPSQFNPLQLLIGSDSTYRGFPTYAWDSRPDKLRDGESNITHSEGCDFNFNDRLAEARKLLRSRFVPTSELSDDGVAEAKSHFGDLAKSLLLNQEPTSTATASSALPNPSRPLPIQGNDQNQPENPDSGWLGAWNAILSKAFSVFSGEGLVGFCGQFYLSHEGIFIKGCAGMSLALGRLVVMGGRVKVDRPAAGATIAAGTLLYFIPWGSVIAFLRRSLWKIWDFVRGVVAAVWETIKKMARGVVLCFKGEEKAKDIMLLSSGDE